MTAAARPDPGATDSAEKGVSAALRLERPRFSLDLPMRLSPGSVVTLLGPNGAGKSTALRCLAGLERLTGGHLHLDGRRLDEPDRNLFVPPAQRSVGVVFQDYLLFPHLSALENVAFGLRSEKLPRRLARSQAAHWLRLLGVDELATVKPGAMSGGQAQRVALARALARSPRLLLLDEPTAALDVGTKMQVRSDLGRHLAAFPGCTVLVTHDPLDAMVLSDWLVVLEDGRVVQQGTPREVARAPRTDYVARLMGLNLYRGVAHRFLVELDGGGTLSTSSPQEGPVFLAFRPSAVALHREQPAGSARNSWPGRVTGLEQHADIVRVQVEGAPSVLSDVTTAAVADLDLTPGAPVWAAVKATEIHTYPA